MGLFTSPRETSLYAIFSDLAQCVNESAEILSRALAEAPGERERFAQALAEKSMVASGFNRRIANRLATSLITPFEADALHALTHAMNNTVASMERLAQLAARIELGTLPPRVMEVLSIVERASELIVQGAWSFNRVGQLNTFYEDMRRLVNHGDTHVRIMLVDLLSADTVSIELLRMREIVGGLERVLASLNAVAQSVDLLRVKDS